MHLLKFCLTFGVHFKKRVVFILLFLKKVFADNYCSNKL